MRDSSHTGRVLVGATAVLLALEAWAVRRPRDRWETVSDQVWKAVDWSPWVSIVSGVVCGHWFLHLRQLKNTTIPFAAGAALGAVYWGRGE